MQDLAGMASVRVLVLALLLALCAVSVLARTPSWDGKIQMPTEEKEKDEEGTRWAILIAGSAGYWNYRHQVLIKLFFSVLESLTVFVVPDSDSGIIIIFD